MAVESFRDGRVRQGQKFLKKSQNQNGDALLGLIVGSLYHHRETERTAQAKAVMERWPWRIDSDTETFGFVATSHVVEDARIAWNTGDKELALGMLRNDLDANENDWIVREQYLRWILELEDPRGWRAELADLINRLKIRPKLSIIGYCQQCGLPADTPTVICPRCDTLGSFGRMAVKEVLRARYLDKPVGVGIDTMVNGVEIEQARGTSS
jgi:hypothetical protein